MTKAKNALALALALTALAATERFDLVKVDVKDLSDVRRLERMGCVVNGPGPDGRWLVEVPGARVEELAAEDRRVEVLVPDIYRFYEKNARDYRFHTYNEVKDSFMTMARNNPTFVRFETLGYASNDSLLFALRITDNPGVEEDEPELMFEAAIHGDEKCATEPIFEWAAYLVRNYGTDPDVTFWVDTREIWVQCVCNPYGHINGRRANQNGIDCNRDYGFMWYYEHSAGGPFTQPETQVHARLCQRNAFNYWSSGHGGTYFVSTPWSYSYFGTRDSMELQYLAEQYHNITGYPYGPGARGMYPINGASKDYAYGSLGGVGWTVETCIFKTPPVESLAQITAREHTAMRMVLANIDRGVRGIVTDSSTGLPVRARVRPMPIDFPSFCDSIGDYHRYLRPGTYDLVFEANGYRTKTVTGVVVAADTVTRVDVALAADTAAPATLHQFMYGRGVSHEAIASTPDRALGKPDSQRFSMGRGGLAVFDFGRRIFNVPGTDITVYEEDADPEGYRVEVASELFGPWTVLDTATGTAEFDLNSGGIDSCRYLKVVDDSSAVSGATAGFDLDAVEAVVVNLPEIAFMSKTVVDSPPGGNADGDLDPGEYADLILELKNVGRAGVSGLEGVLRTADTLVSVLDSLGSFGDLEPDSTGSNETDRFVLEAELNTPLEYTASLMLYLSGTNFEDSISFAVMVGEVHATDPIPDTGPVAQWYFAYDDGDVQYNEAPVYEWVEIRDIGTRLELEDQQTVQVPLPSEFGPFKFYGQRFDTISVCSNGWIAPGVTTDRSWQNRPLPTNRHRAMLALCWDDLYPAYGNGVWYYHDQAHNRFIVEYDSVH
ncbi:MAG: carboxypeptidase regulatory-like domain-containing protein, partial [candidate division WOR-3 bacterium]